MQYRADIDGLRAISVIAVILFHLGSQYFTGGFVGVDVFFVISGYLITTMIYTEIALKQFSFKQFYTRRIARLFPSLIITLFISTLFGFFFYSPQTFDNLGKEVLFSAFGAVNILFSQGVNYFVSEKDVRPLLHLWSLGIEEQFYFFWPSLLLAISILNKKKFLFLSLILLFLLTSLFLSSVIMVEDKIKAYFLPQYRAFELLIGAFIAILLKEKMIRQEISSEFRESLSGLGIVLIIIPIFLYNDMTLFPGYNALLPCIGATLLIIYAENTAVGKFLHSPILVFIGLISYPLYLIHQPLISYIEFFDLAALNSVKIIVVLTTSVPLAWCMYKYIEIPIRKNVKEKSDIHIYCINSLCAGLVLIGLSGLWIAKSNGLNWRFKILNPFAYSLISSHATTFHTNFPRGINIENNSAKILFVGDSLLQQYMLPFAEAKGFHKNEIDSVTRGGCVLLKGVNFEDKFSDISCTELREQLYASKKTYKTVVISQNWNSYDLDIKNAKIQYSTKNYSLEKWQSFLEKTISHFKLLSDNIIIIGGHPEIKGTNRISPNIFITPKKYYSNLKFLQIVNLKNLEKTKIYFESKFGNMDGVKLMHPQDIWYHKPTDSFKLHNDKFSFFSDEKHISSISTPYAVKRIKFYDIN